MILRISVISVCCCHSICTVSRNTFRCSLCLILSRCIECIRGLAMRILSVRLSVRQSVKCVNYDKTEERSVQIFIPYERSFNLVFWEE